MHEWALAEAVLESLRGHAGSRRVRRVVLRFGELQQVDREIFSFALRELAEDIDAEVFEIETEPAAFACNACGAAWSLDAGSALSPGEKEATHFLPEAAKAFVRCPACGGPDFQVVRGRGVTIETIETDEAAAGG